MTLIKKVAFGVVALAVISTLNSPNVFAKTNIFGGMRDDESSVLPMIPQEVQAPVTTNTDQTLNEAMSNLNTAQAVLRNNLSQAQAKYAEVDKKYVQVKLERKLAKNNVKTINKKLKNIESAKKKIKKNLAKTL